MDTIFREASAWQLKKIAQGLRIKAVLLSEGMFTNVEADIIIKHYLPYIDANAADDTFWSYHTNVKELIYKRINKNWR